MAKKEKQPRRPKQGTKAYSAWIYANRKTEAQHRKKRPPRTGAPSSEKKPRPGPPLKAVTEIASEHNSLIELRVAKEDVGKVIGKEGRTAQSMRTILAAVSTKLGKRAHLDIVD